MNKPFRQSEDWPHHNFGPVISRWLGRLDLISVKLSAPNGKPFFIASMEKWMHKFALTFALCGSLGIGTPAFAQTGRVATVCAADIQKYCANKGHGDRQTRSCLGANRKEFSVDCQKALASTRGGRR